MEESLSTPAPESNMHRLAPSVVTVWRIQSGLFFLGLALMSVFYEVLELFSEESLLPFGMLTGGIVVVGSLLVFFLPRLRYRYWRYVLRHDELHARYGVLNRVYTIVPLHRIQHMDVSQSIIEREFQLARLIVHTAGTRNSEVVVPGLPLDDAEAMRDQLRSYVQTVRE